MGILDAPTRIQPTDYRKLTEGNLGLAPVASTGQARSIATSTALTHSYQKRLLMRVAGRGLRLDYSNFVNNAAAGTGPIEAATGNPITVKSYILLALSASTPIPVTWNGSSSVVIPSGARAPLSDAVEIDLAQGTMFYVVTVVTVATIGDKIPQQVYVNAGRNEGAHAADDSGLVGGIGSGNYANTYVYAPSHVWGIPYSNQRTARHAAVGDSIRRGASQTGDDDGLNIIPPFSQTATVNVACYGEFAGQTALPNGMSRRISQIDGCTSWDDNSAVNDLKGSHVLATVMAAKVTVWQKIAQRLGVAGYQWTIGPSTTSTDTWATTTNQTAITANNFNADRILFNAWIRDGAPINSSTFAVVATGTSPAGTIRAGAAGHPLAGYLEVADIVESARDSGIFKAGYSFDGTHFSTSAYTAIAAGIDWTRLGIV